MKPAESVENESTARPFQCDWQSCPKSFTRKSDFVRHYRIHTDERPYVCPIPGCGKRFTRPDIQAKHMLTHTGKKPHQCRHIGFGKRFTDASTLARHRWRLHQQEMSPNDSNDSDDDGSPSTPQLPMNQVHGYHIPQHRDNRQGIPASVPHEYHGTPVPEQYTPVQPVHRATTMTQEVYYVTEAENPGVATMTNTVPPHYQLSQQGERPPMEIPYSALGTAMSVQSSPSTVSATSVPSPTIPEGFYAHQPGSQPAYTAAESQPAMIEYQQLIQQPMVSQLQYIPATTRYYTPPPAHPQQEQWPYYHPPIEVTTTGQLAAYEPAVYDIYGPKIEFEDPSLQPLSIRLASM